MKWSLQIRALVVSAPPERRRRFKIHFLQRCSVSFLHFSPLWTTIFGTLKKKLFFFSVRTIRATVNHTKHRHFFRRQIVSSLPALHLHFPLSRCSNVKSRETQLFDSSPQFHYGGIHLTLVGDGETTIGCEPYLFKSADTYLYAVAGWVKESRIWHLEAKKLCHHSTCKKFNNSF